MEYRELHRVKTDDIITVLTGNCWFGCLAGFRSAVILDLCSSLGLVYVRHCLRKHLGVFGVTSNTRY